MLSLASMNGIDTLAHTLGQTQRTARGNAPSNKPRRQETPTHIHNLDNREDQSCGNFALQSLTEWSYSRQCFFWCVSQKHFLGYPVSPNIFICAPSEYPNFFLHVHLHVCPTSAQIRIEAPHLPKCLPACLQAP